MFAKKIIKTFTFVLTLVMIINLMAVCTASADTGIEIILTDVTESNPTTMTGEAKIKVSVKGAAGDINAMQAALDFSGKLEYKSVDYLIKADAPAETDPYTANAYKKVSVGFALSSAASFTKETDVFVLTFEGNAGDEVTVTVDNEHSFCYSASGTSYAKGKSSVTAKSATKAKEGMDATVRIVMDKVNGFVASSESGVTLRITDQDNGNVIKALLNEENRDSGSKAEFTVTNTVIKGNKYTVELYGIGYVTYKAEDITFDEVLTITNKEFIPGDVDKDGKVTDEDKKAYDEIVSKDEYNAAADFNRDGYVDEKDNVFGEKDTSTVPAKVKGLTLSVSDTAINASWNVPSDGGSSITGYKVLYGTSESNLTSSLTSTKNEAQITGLSRNTTYYVKVAAVNSKGTGEYSDILSITIPKKTDGDSGSGGGGGGGGFGGGGGGGTTTTPVVTPSVTTPGGFTDLTNYEWASDAIYSLRDAGIINGINASQFAPQNNIRRADFILILVRMMKLTGDTSTNFADVPKGSYYYDAVAIAKAHGIATGDGVNFMPESSITRQDLITLSYRAFVNAQVLTQTDDLTVLDAFTDKDMVSEYARAAMASMVKAGIIKGADGRLNPLGNATRAEVAVMCDRLYQLTK